MATKIKLGNGNWGVKDGGTLAYNDENGVFKAIELASSRASGATYVSQSGLIADAEAGVPRIDWTNGVGELLLEPQSTNLITYSEDFTNASWLKINGGLGSIPIVTSNQGLSPDGSVNADRVQFDLGGGTSSSDSSILAFSGTLSGVNQNTRSVYLKSNTSSSYSMILGTNSPTADNSVVEIVVTTEWQRFDLTHTPTTTTTNFYFGLRNAFGITGLSDTADILIFGAQLEELSYPTSYIRTSGSSVTRIADAVTGNSSLGQVINSSEGVLYAEMSALANDGTQNLLGLNGGSISNSILFGFSSSNGIRFYGAESGTATGFDLTTAATITSNLKLALRWSLNDVKFYINGTQVGTDTTFATSSSLNELSFDNGSGASPFYGRIRDLRVYDTALTDAELTALTTL